MYKNFFFFFLLLLLNKILKVNSFLKKTFINFFYTLNIK